MIIASYLATVFKENKGKAKGRKVVVAERVSVELKPQLATNWGYYNPYIGIAVHILYTPA